MWGEKSFLDIFKILMDRHKGKMIGVILGLLVGLLIILFGFWKALFIITCIVIGYLIGKRFDEEGPFGEWWERFWGGR